MTPRLLMESDVLVQGRSRRPSHGKRDLSGFARLLADYVLSRGSRPGLPPLEARYLSSSFRPAFDRALGSNPEIFLERTPRDFG